MLTKADEGFAVTVVVTAANAVGIGLRDGRADRSGRRRAAGQHQRCRSIQSPSPLIQQGVTLTVGRVRLGQHRRHDLQPLVGALRRRRAAGRSAAPPAPQYTLLAADVGHTIVAVSTATNVDGSVSARSAETAVATLMAGPRWKTLPLISNSPGRVGDTVTRRRAPGAARSSPPTPPR